MSLENVFKVLLDLDEQGISSIDIDSNGIYTYRFNTPTRTEYLEPLVNNKYAVENGCSLYRVHRNGDLLLSVDLEGLFEKAELFQFDWTGSRKVIYDTISTPGQMKPFPTSGFPLLQCGKIAYIEVKSPLHVSVRVTHAYLEKKSRRKLIEYVHPNTKHGIKAVHACGDVYQALDIFDYGYSPNYFAPVQETPES